MAVGRLARNGGFELLKITLCVVRAQLGREAWGCTRPTTGLPSASSFSCSSWPPGLFASSPSTPQVCPTLLCSLQPPALHVRCHCHAFRMRLRCRARTGVAVAVKWMLLNGPCGKYQEVGHKTAFWLLRCTPDRPQCCHAVPMTSTAKPNTEHQQPMRPCAILANRQKMEMSGCMWGLLQRRWRWGR